MKKLVLGTVAVLAILATVGVVIVLTDEDAEYNDIPERDD